MKDHYVSFECAQALKRLGFKEEVSHYYCHFKSDGEVKLWSTNPPDNHNARLSINEVCSAPRLDQAAAWLREVKGWDVTSIPTLAKCGEKKYRWDVCHWSKPEYGECSDGIFDTYEDALSAGLDCCIELLTKEENDV